MDIDDLEPKKKKAYELGQDLSKLSVGELAELDRDAEGRDRAGGGCARGETLFAQRRRCGLQALTNLAHSLPLGKSRLSVNSLLGGFALGFQPSSPLDLSGLSTLFDASLLTS